MTIDKFLPNKNKIFLSFILNISSGKNIAEDSVLLSVLKMNKLMLEEHKNTQIIEYVNDKINVQNAISFYNLANLYKIINLSKLTSSYIERCFAMVIETQCFLELDYNIIAKILVSSDLSIHSELEVFNAANNWLKHNSKDRGKFAKQLLLKVRLPLLSDHAL